MLIPKTRIKKYLSNNNKRIRIWHLDEFAKEFNNVVKMLLDYLVKENNNKITLKPENVKKLKRTLEKFLFLYQ